MAKVIVFGAGGQVSVDLIPMLFERGVDLTLVDLLPAGKTEAGRACGRYFAARDQNDWESWWRVLDGTDAALTHRLIDEIRPDTIYNLAALLSAKCEENTERCWQVNMALFTNVLEGLRHVATADYRPKLLWPSSIAAFGPLPGSTGGYEPGNEYPLLPTTMYGVTKVACEALGTYYYERHGVDFRSVRFPGLINDAEPGGGSSDYANQMYFDAINGSEPEACFVSPQSRIPFMYMRDAVRALIELAEAPDAWLTRRVYNIKAFRAPSAGEIAASIAGQVPGFKVSYEPDHREAYVDSWPDDFDDQPAIDDWKWKPEVDSIDSMTRRLLSDLRAKKAMTGI